MAPKETDDAPKVLVVDDDRAQTRLLEHYLETADYSVETFTSGEQCLDGLARTLPDAILLDLNMPGLGGMETLHRIQAQNPRLPVVILTSDTEVSTVVTAMQGGAFDYLAKPVSPTRVLTVLRNAVKQARMELKLAQLERDIGGSGFDAIIGQSTAMKRLFREMERVAPSDVTVLIHGESGTGKELVAQALHTYSGRRDKPFVALNCAAIPETLQESELFGHERGAFTGAASRRIGRFEQADGGTLFLDEVGELSPSLQAKLLRVIQERRFHRVGGSQEIKVDVRLLAATHRELSAEVEAGRFREDLFYRLAVFELDVPPLKDRVGDVTHLARHFAAGLAKKYGGGEVSFTPQALAALEAYDWPGNVRQLQNAMERATVVARDGRIERADLPRAVRENSQRRPHHEPTMPSDAGQRVPQHHAAPPRHAAPPPSGGGSLADLERQAIIDALEQSNGNVSEVCRALSIPRTTLYRKLKKYGMR